MATPRQIEANRKNAQKSTGPKTPAGKQHSKLNALKHGLDARTIVLPGEDESAYQQRLASWTAELAPSGALAAYLARRAVDLSWQLDRADRAERARLAELARAQPRSRRRAESRRAAPGDVNALSHGELAVPPPLVETVQQHAFREQAAHFAAGLTHNEALLEGPEDAACEVDAAPQPGPEPQPEPQPRPLSDADAPAPDRPALADLPRTLLGDRCAHCTRLLALREAEEGGPAREDEEAESELEAEAEADQEAVPPAHFDQSAEGERLHRYQANWSRGLLRTLDALLKLKKAEAAPGPRAAATPSRPAGTNPTAQAEAAEAPDRGPASRRNTRRSVAQTGKTKPASGRTPPARPAQAGKPARPEHRSEPGFVPARVAPARR